jgi:thiol-disulfide isomerase/thioredoxin
MGGKAIGAAVLVAGFVAALAVAFSGSGGQRTIGSGGRHVAPPSAPGAEPRMLELYAPWCSLCAGMKPVMEDLATRCAGKGVRIDAVDISRGDNEAIAEQYDVRSVPTFLFLDANGFETGRLVGAQSAQELRRGLEALSGVSCAGPAPMARPAVSATKEG